MVTKKIIIIGGGITGISLARLLQQKGEDNVLVLEAKKEAGGLCQSKLINGAYLDLGGGHFFYTKHQEVYNFIFSHIPKNKFKYFDRVSKVRIDGEEVDYPIECNLWQLSKQKQIDYLISVIRNGEALGKKQPKNYSEWIRWKLGNKIADSYMIPYNRKIWGVNPNKMDIDWLYKIPRLQVPEIVESCLFKDKGVDKMPSHPGFYYPKKGGFQVIFDAIYEKIKEKVVLEEKVISIKRKNKLWLVNNKYKAKILINTAPWPSIFKALGSPKNLKKHFKKLKSNSLVVSLWNKKYSHNYHWIYDPDLEKEYHREFFISNYSIFSKKNVLYTETNKKRWPGKNIKWKNGKRPVFEYINKVAYPIPLIGNTTAINCILEYYKKFSLFGVGRWGQWKYYNADACILEAMILSDSILGKIK